MKSAPTSKFYKHTLLPQITSRKYSESMVDNVNVVKPLDVLTMVLKTILDHYLASIKNHYKISELLSCNCIIE